MTPPDLPPALPRVGLFATEWRAFFVVAVLGFLILAGLRQGTIVGHVSFGAAILIVLIGAAHSIMDSLLRARPPVDTEPKRRTR